MTPAIVDLFFPIVGNTLPSDHGFALYSALTRVVPELHDAPWWGLHTVRGTRAGPGVLQLGRAAAAGLRLPSDRIGAVLPLAGRTLVVDGHRVALAPPTVHALAPAPALSARIVTVKGFLDPAPFANAVRRQLEEMEVAASVELGTRKIVCVRDRKIVGYSVRIAGLADARSILVQEHGIGGRRRFGCGLFRPSIRPLAVDRRPEPAADAE